MQGYTMILSYSGFGNGEHLETLGSDPSGPLSCVSAIYLCRYILFCSVSE